MSEKIRIYLDFDGTVTALAPGAEHGRTITVDGETIPIRKLNWILETTREPTNEIVWATHREDDIHHVVSLINSTKYWADWCYHFPRFPHLTFTDPTGSKVKDIIAHYEANPCRDALVMDDAFTPDEIKTLNDAGLTVVEFHNAIASTTHLPDGKKA